MTQEQWLAANPGKTVADYRNWVASQNFKSPAPGSSIGTNKYLDPDEVLPFSGPSPDTTIGTNLYLDPDAVLPFSGPAESTTIGTDVRPGRGTGLTSAVPNFRPDPLGRDTDSPLPGFGKGGVEPYDYGASVDDLLMQLAQLQYEGRKRDTDRVRDLANYDYNRELVAIADEYDRARGLIPEMQQYSGERLAGIEGATNIDDIPDEVLVAALEEFGLGDILNETSDAIALGDMAVGAGPVAGDAAAIEAQAALMADTAGDLTRAEAQNLNAQMAALQALSGEAAGAARIEAGRRRAEDIADVQAARKRTLERDAIVSGAEKTVDDYYQDLVRKREENLINEEIRGVENVALTLNTLGSVSNDLATSFVANNPTITPIYDMALSNKVISQDEHDLLVRYSNNMYTADDQTRLADEIPRLVAKLQSFASRS